MMRVKGLTGPQADSVHRIRGLMAPQVAGRRSQVAMDSDAAARRQVHMDPPPLDKNGLWLNFTAGCPLGQPLRTGLCHVFLLYPVNDIPFIACMRYRRGRPKGGPP